MSDVIEVLPVSLIAFFSLRAQEIAAASQLVKANTTAVQGFNAAAGSTGGRDSASRTITLELTQARPPSNSNNADVGTTDASGLTTIAHIEAGRTTVQRITFDVGARANGYAQTVNITASARQSVHQTAAGFYLDEFNLGVGQLAVEADVLFGAGSPADQVQTFFDLLYKAKVTEPISSEPALRLKFFDSYLARSLVITQDNVRLSLDAERPNRARLSIAATILYDYSTPTAAPSASSSLNTPTAVTADLGALTTMSSPGGAISGAP